MMAMTYGSVYERNPMQLDSKAPSLPLQQYVYNETMLAHADPQNAKRLLDLAQQNVRTRWRLYEELAGINLTVNGSGKTEAHTKPLNPLPSIHD